MNRNKYSIIGKIWASARLTLALTRFPDDGSANFCT